MNSCPLNRARNNGRRPPRIRRSNAQRNRYSRLWETHADSERNPRTPPTAVNNLFRRCVSHPASGDPPAPEPWRALVQLQFEQRSTPQRK